MDKSTDGENSTPTSGKSTKNGNGKDKPKALQQQAAQKPAVKRKRKKVKDVNAPKHPLTGKYGSYVRYNYC